MNNFSTIESLKASRPWSFAVITIIYLIAAALGVWTFLALDETAVLLRLFVADFVATVFVWLWGVIFRNSSVYDPYWSVAPPLMLTGYAVYCGAFSLPVLLMLVAVWYWAIRLTGNWAYTFPNLNKQDWRYDMYKERFPRLWHIVNFTGINLMPTIVVFLAMIPGFLLIGMSAASPLQANIWTWLGFFVCISAATLQLISDTQAHRFRRDHRGEVCTVGLWNRSRHPNYLGEILMWWGVALSVVCAAPQVWYLCAGAAANTVLFLCVSIPMADGRQSRKEGFAEYKRQTRMLLPIKRKV